MTAPVPGRRMRNIREDMHIIGAMPSAILIQKPAGQPEHLFLLLHGVGADAEDMIPLGHAIANLFLHASVASLDGTEPCDFSSGRQWFSIQNATDDNRVARVAAALPTFVDAVRGIQRETGTVPANTTLIGFSQGGIMALESSLLPDPPAQRIVAISSRFAQLPERRPGAQIHLVHGELDDVIACTHTVKAAARLHQLGAHATADIVPDTGHEINAGMLEKIVTQLTRAEAKSTP